jgi:hypothetical protein
MSESPFHDVLAALADSLLHCGCNWYLFGAQAALLYGSTRLTSDVDITIYLGDQTVGTLVRCLEAAGFELRIKDDEFLRQTSVLPLVHLPTSIPVDAVLAGPGLEERFLERATVHRLGNLQVPVARAEDVIAMKILAGRPKDLEDALAILATQGTRIDLALIRSTLDILERALDQNDLMPELDRLVQQARRDTRRDR